MKKTFEAGGNKKTEAFWKELIKGIDENGDGKITLEEFTKGMEKLI